LVLEGTPYDIRLDATLGELAFKTAHHGIDVDFEIQANRSSRSRKPIDRATRVR